MAKLIKKTYQVEIEKVGDDYSIQTESKTVTEEVLVNMICTEQDFDDAFYYISVLYNQVDEAQFSVYPSVNETQKILTKHNCKFIVLGLWIVMFFEDNEDKIADKVWEELNSIDLVPYCGYGLKYCNFIKRADYQHTK